MRKSHRLSFPAIAALALALALAACGDNTATTAPAATTPPAAAATTAPAAAATTAPAAAATTAPAASTGGDATMPKGDPNLKAEINVQSWNVAGKALAANVAGFNKLYPNVKVNVDFNTGRQDVYDKFTTALAAQSGEGLPDVIQIESDHMESYTSKYPNAFADLTANASKYDSMFDPSKWAQSKANGKIYSIPWDSGPVGLFYRKDLADKAGVDMTKVETWDDFIAAGVKFQAANPGTKMAALDYNNDDGLFRMILNEQGKYYFTKDGKIDFTSPEAVKAMTIIKKLKDAGLTSNAAGGWNDLVSGMKNGQTAGQAFGVWWTGTIMDSAPETKGKWGVILMPAVEKGGPRASNLGGSTLAIPGTSKNKDAAWAFIEYNLATAEGQNAMMKNFGLWPSFLPAYKDPFYSTPSDFFGNVWPLFTAEVPKIPAVTYTGDNDKALQAGAKAQSAVINGTDPAKALADQAKALANDTGRALAGQ